MIKKISDDGRIYHVFTRAEKNNLSKSMKHMHAERRRGVPFPQRRNVALYSFRLSGHSFEACGRRFRITGERARQVFNFHHSKLMHAAKNQLRLLSLDFHRCGIPHFVSPVVLGIIPLDTNRTCVLH